jgi:hypothetical protein
MRNNSSTGVRRAPGPPQSLVAIVATAALLVFPALSDPSRANDSTASLDTGGLELTYNPDIRVEAEDLYISRAQIRVAYRFHNTSDRDIATLVAFPLPEMEIGEDGNYALEGRDPDNIMDFRVTVDGKPVEPSVDIKATRFGVDVTELLRRHEIPLTLVARDSDALLERLNRLPPEARRELERYGVIDWNTSFGAGNKPLANPHWDTNIAYYWLQTFPAGRTIEVMHRYRPVPREFILTAGELASAETRSKYCVDPSFIETARSRLQRSAQQTLAGYELKYVLTTAGNWQGTIGSFHLTVDKGVPDALVFLCADDVRRTGPTTFTLSRKDFSPAKDLDILFVEPQKAD